MKKIGYKTKAAAAAEAAARTEGKPARRNDARIIRRVIKRQESVTRKDIADWKRARLQATSTYEPKQVLLQRLFSEVIDDALMTSQVSVLRIGKSQGAEFELKMNGRKDEAETQKFKDSGLYEDLVELIVEAQFFNHSLIEFDYDPAGTVVADLVPRENVSPEVGKFYPDAEGSETVDYRLLPEFGRWLVEIYPRKRDLGLLNKAVPYVLIKKFALSCWSELCEIFGIPPRVMKTNTTDDEMLERAETMMREIGSAAYFIIDTTEDFEFAQGVATNGDVYKNLISTCDQQLSLLNLAAVLGQDTENGNRSKEESSAKLMEAVVKADKRLIESSFNRKILPALAAIGFLKPGLRLEITKEVDLEKLWKMTYEASQNYDVDPEWIRDTFGIAVIGKKQQGALPPGGDGERQDGEGAEDGADGHAFFAEAPQDGASDGESLTPRDEALVGRVAAGKSDYWDAELFEYIASDLLKAVRIVFAHTSGAVEAAVEYDVPDDVYTAALEQNLFHFSAAKTLAEVQELNQAFRESKNYNEFKARAAEITRTFNDRWQRTEYRTAVQVAEAASNYRQLRRRADIFPYWVYRTAGDGRAGRTDAPGVRSGMAEDLPAERLELPLPGGGDYGRRVRRGFRRGAEEDAGVSEEPRMEADDGSGLGREPGRDGRDLHGEPNVHPQIPRPGGFAPRQTPLPALRVAVVREAVGGRDAGVRPVHGRSRGMVRPKRPFYGLLRQNDRTPRADVRNAYVGQIHRSARAFARRDRRGSAAARRGMAEQLRRQGVRLSELHPLLPRQGDQRRVPDRERKDARRPDVVRNSHPPDDQKRRKDRTGERPPAQVSARAAGKKVRGAFQRSPVLRGPVPGSRPCCFNGLRSRCYRSASD